MSVTSLQPADKERCLIQIERLIHSHTFRKAEALCKLLRYLANHALAQPGVPSKEYEIATEVFGRPRDFDPQADSAIRVQAGRLRLKLHDYYTHEGLSDTVVVEVPNGSYALNFHDREMPQPGPVPVPASFQLPVEPRIRDKSRRAWIITVSILSLVLAAALAAVATLSVALNSARTGKRSESTASGALTDLLESIRFRSRCALGNFQQRSIRGATGNGHALFGPGTRFP